MTPGRPGKVIAPLSSSGTLAGEVGCTTVCIIVGGPFAWWLSTTVGPDKHARVIILSIGGAWALVSAVLLVGALVHRAKARRIHRELDLLGVRADAEVTASRRIGVGEMSDPADKLRFRVTGPGITGFEAEHVSEDPDRYQVGMHIPVDVDPRTNVFRLVG